MCLLALVVTYWYCETPHFKTQQPNFNDTNATETTYAFLIQYLIQNLTTAKSTKEPFFKHLLSETSWNWPKNITVTIVHLSPPRIRFLQIIPSSWSDKNGTNSQCICNRGHHERLREYIKYVRARNMGGFFPRLSLWNKNQSQSCDSGVHISLLKNAHNTQVFGLGNHI